MTLATLSADNIVPRWSKISAVPCWWGWSPMRIHMSSIQRGQRVRHCSNPAWAGRCPPLCAAAAGSMQRQSPG